MALDLFNNFYKGKRVLVTGHTGFKGSWLSIWLHELGAKVVGVALDPYSDKDNFVLSDIGKKIKADIRADIRDGEKMKQIFTEYQPEIVFHLAAQPLVRLSYEIPVETYEANVMGTIHLMEAIRATESVKVGVMITTDKCYENKEQIWGYRENEPMGGYDPYSSSKGAAEIAISSWRRSFFNPADYGKGELKDVSDPNALHEAKLLMLDINKAHFKLGWEPRMNIDQCMAMVAEWYKRYQGEDVYNLCVEQINKYVG